MTTITPSKNIDRQVDEINASGRVPVVFVHGLWLLASSWDRWAAVFKDAGYAPLLPGWPDDPEKRRRVPLRLNRYKGSASTWTPARSVSRQAGLW